MPCPSVEGGRLMYVSILIIPSSSRSPVDRSEWNPVGYWKPLLGIGEAGF